VLFVDDEDMVLRVGTRMLERLGFRVLRAAGGEAAIDIFRDRADDIDLVLLDMVMPGLSGSQVFEALREIDPDVDVLLSTGYSIDDRAADVLRRGCRGYVQKPYSIATLAEKIDAVLARGGQPPAATGGDGQRPVSPG
jgi:CheY-like chemotaxis protein